MEDYCTTLVHTQELLQALHKYCTVCSSNDCKEIFAEVPVTDILCKQLICLTCFTGRI